MALARSRGMPALAALLLAPTLALAASGARDASFGSGGASSPTLPAFWYGSPYRFLGALDTEGNVLVAGLRTLSRDPGNPLNYTAAGAVARLTPRGVPDTTFGGDGLNDGAPGMRPQGLLALDNGRLLLAGWVGTYASEDYLAARFLADGSNDTGFGASGTSGGGVVSDTGSAAYDQVESAALAADGSLVLVGHYITPDARRQVTLMRLRPDGSRDTGFGSNGIATPVHAGSLRPTAVVTMPDGRLLVAGTGYRYDIGSNCGFVQRMLADGSLDSAFATNGTAWSCLAGRDYSNLVRVALQPDGRIVATGLAGNLGLLSHEIFVLRLAPTGQPDTAFGSAGVRRDLFGSLLGAPASHLSEYLSLALQPDGRIVVGSASITSGMPSHMLTRLLADGRTDAGFAAQGLLKEGDPYRLNDVIVQPDGKLLATASAWSSNGQTAPSSFRVYRYLANDADNNGIAEPWDLTPAALVLDAPRLPEGSVTVTATVPVSGLGSGLRVPADVLEAELSLDGGQTWSRERAYVANGDTITLRFRAGANPWLAAGGMHAVNNAATVLGTRTIASIRYPAEDGGGTGSALQAQFLLPKPGAVNVPRYRPRVMARFRDRLDPASIGMSALALSCDGEAIAGFPALSGGGRMLVLQPLTSLPAGAHCTATLDASLRDLQGNVLAAPASWSFYIRP